MLFAETDGYNPEEPALTAGAPAIPPLPPSLMLPRLPIRPRFPGTCTCTLPEPNLCVLLLTIIDK